MASVTKRIVLELMNVKEQFIFLKNRNKENKDTLRVY